jgi:hypothetical protein
MQLLSSVAGQRTVTVRAPVELTARVLLASSASVTGGLLCEEAGNAA